MLLVGTALAFASLIGSLALAAHEAPAYLVIGTYLAPLPYTLFIVIAVWRSSTEVVRIQKITVRTITASWGIVAVLL